MTKWITLNELRLNKDRILRYHVDQNNKALNILYWLGDRTEWVVVGNNYLVNAQILDKEFKARKVNDATAQ